MERYILDNIDDDFSGSAILVVFADKRGILVVNLGDVVCFGLKNVRINRQNMVEKTQLNPEHTL